MGAGRRRAALIVRTVLLAALVLALAGFQLVLPVDRLATVFVVDLSDSVGNAGRADALAFLRETLEEKPRRRRRGHRRVRQGRAGRAAAVRARGHRPDRVGAGQVRDRHRRGAAPRDGALPRRRPEADRAADRRQRHDRRRPGRGAPSPRAAASRSRRAGSGSATPTRSSSSASRRRRRRASASRSRRSPRSARSVAQPATVRLFADGTQVAIAAGRARGRASPGSRSTSRRPRPASTRSASASRPRATRSARTTGPTRTRSSRASRGRSSSPATTRSRPSSSQALESQRQQVDTIVPEALPTDFAGLATYDSIVLVDVPRLRLIGPPAGRAPGLRPRPRQGPGHGRRPRQLRRRRLPEDAARGDAARSTWASATAQKQPDIALVVVIDQSGSMAACHCNTFDRGSGSGHRRRPEGRHRQGGDPARRRGDDRARRARRRRLQRGRPLGRPDPAARRRRRPAGPDRRDPGRRPDEHLRRARPGGAVARGRHRDPPPHHPADRRLVHLRPVRRDPRPR